MIKLYKYKISDKTKEKLKENLHFLSTEELKRAKKYKFEKDFSRYAVGKIMARKIISNQYDIAHTKVKFYVDEFDRPFLKHPIIKNIDFNISHSGDFVLFAYSNRRIGIDIEKIKPIDLKISKECFHKFEIDYVFGQNNKKLERFYKIWTLKESFIKNIGQGLSYPLKNFYTINDINGCLGLRILDSLEQVGLNLKSYNSIAGYKIALCSEKKKLPKKFIDFNF